MNYRDCVVLRQLLDEVIHCDCVVLSQLFIYYDHPVLIQLLDEVNCCKCVVCQIVVHQNGVN